MKLNAKSSCAVTEDPKWSSDPWTAIRPHMQAHRGQGGNLSLQQQPPTYAVDQKSLQEGSGGETSEHQCALCFDHPHVQHNKRKYAKMATKTAFYRIFSWCLKTQPNVRDGRQTTQTLLAQGLMSCKPLLRRWLVSLGISSGVSRNLCDILPNWGSSYNYMWSWSGRNSQDEVIILGWWSLCLSLCD